MNNNDNNNILNRPGLSEFLKDMSKKYEMHIYTMGTRSYAEAVVKEIDPTGVLFQDRILSRDENGSMTKKRLERLFPSDISKVLVLDDRGDVWDYSPNLIQIKPYEYFIGIGDINSPFAQPKKDIIPSAETLAKPSNILKEVDQENSIESVAINSSESSIIEDSNTKDINNKVIDDDNKEINNEESNIKNNGDEEPKNKEPNDEEHNNKKSNREEHSDKESNDEESNSKGFSKEEPKKKDDHIFKAPAPVQKTETHLPNTHDSDDILRVTRRVSNMNQ